jgi:GNAT superfamily N-acetyltransferase
MLTPPPPASSCAHNSPESSESITLPDGAVLRVRPVALADEARLRRMFYRLSPGSIYTWLFVPAPRIPERAALLAALARVDYERQYALVAVAGSEIVGIARYDLEAAEAEAELAIIVEDAWQQRGLGKLLMHRLIVEASRHCITAFTARMLGENQRALRLVSSLFASVRWEWNSGECQAHARLESLKQPA